MADDPQANSSGTAGEGATLALARRHLRAGWTMLAVYLTLGAVLEALHGFKIGWYLNVSSETRRLMLTLAHAHGDLLGAVNILYAFTLLRERAPARWHAVASGLLLAGSLLLPLGFLLGGLVVYGGDPGLGVLLVPPGAALLLGAVALVAWKVGPAHVTATPPGPVSGRPDEPVEKPAGEPSPKKRGRPIR